MALSKSFVLWEERCTGRGASSCGGPPSRRGAAVASVTCADADPLFQPHYRRRTKPHSRQKCSSKRTTTAQASGNIRALSERDAGAAPPPRRLPGRHRTIDYSEQTGR
ncbi:unnamed protein product, partial [Iphiclides podalirius]